MKSVSREVSGRIYEWKMLPRNVFMALYCLLLFMQSLFLLHQQLVIVLVARIRLLWILEVLIQPRRRCLHRRFHPHWIFPHPLKSICTSSTIFLKYYSVEICEYVEILSTIYWCSEREHTQEVIQSRSLRNPYVAKFDDPMTDGCQGTKDFLAWQNFYSLQS